MNSQLLPVADLSLIQYSIDERLEKASRARALRGLEHRPGVFTPVRLTVSHLLMSVGERLNPSCPINDRSEEHVLLPLAR
jgi:hypothetical protein